MTDSRRRRKRNNHDKCLKCVVVLRHSTKFLLKVVDLNRIFLLILYKKWIRLLKDHNHRRLRILHRHQEHLEVREVPKAQLKTAKTMTTTRNLKNPVISRKPTRNMLNLIFKNAGLIPQRQGSEEEVCLSSDRTQYMDQGQALLKVGKEGVLILQVQNPKTSLKKTIASITPILSI